MLYSRLHFVKNTEKPFLSAIAECKKRLRAQERTE